MKTHLGQHKRFRYLSRITQHAKSHKSLHSNQERSQAEARKSVIQHDMSLDVRHPAMLLANNKGSDKPAHLRSLISTIVIGYLKSKVTR